MLGVLVGFGKENWPIHIAQGHDDIGGRRDQNADDLAAGGERGHGTRHDGGQVRGAGESCVGLRR
ncbi:MAG TPA: hypothetical protein VFB95_08080, partial [Candidatus Cryosericum sp.]|nr:hypothetical protein [Candidatus Cryosericum sp.]